MMTLFEQLTDGSAADKLEIGRKNYATQTRIKNGIAQCYCVECEAWRNIVITASAVVEVTPHRDYPFGQIVEAIDATTVVYRCGHRHCNADVSYLMGHNKEVDLHLANQLRKYGI